MCFLQECVYCYNLKKCFLTQKNVDFISAVLIMTLNNSFKCNLLELLKIYEGILTRVGCKKKKQELVCAFKSQLVQVLINIYSIIRVLHVYKTETFFLFICKTQTLSQVHFKFSQVYSKFQPRMVILHHTSKWAITAIAVVPCLTCYRLHKMFIWKDTKHYCLFNLIKLSEFNLSILLIDANHCSFVSWREISRIRRYFVYNGALNIYTV